VLQKQLVPYQKEHRPHQPLLPQVPEPVEERVLLRV
jgi:hypothetical protein